MIGCRFQIPLEVDTTTSITITVTLASNMRTALIASRVKLHSVNIKANTFSKRVRQFDIEANVTGAKLSCGE